MGVAREVRRTFAFAVIRSVLDGALTREEIKRIPHGCDDPKEEFRRRVYAIIGLILKDPAGLVDENLFLQDYVGSVVQKAIGDQHPSSRAKDVLQHIGLIEHHKVGLPGVPVIKAPRNGMMNVSIPTTINPVPRLIVPLEVLGLSDRFNADPLPGGSDATVTALVKKITRKGDEAIQQALLELKASQSKRP